MYRKQTQENQIASKSSKKKGKMRIKPWNTRMTKRKTPAPVAKSPILREKHQVIFHKKAKNMKNKQKTCRQKWRYIGGKT